jgi:tetratricopeptide (TPR) repeat protein
MGQHAQAEQYLDEALDLAKKLLAARPNEVLSKANLADAHYLTSEVRLFAGQLDEARTQLKACRDLYEAIVREEPRNVYFQRNLGKAYYRLGNINLLEEKSDAARADFDKSLEICTALAGLSKDNDRRQMDLMRTLAQVGRVDDAIATADRLVAGPKVDSELRIDLARCYAICSRVLPKAQAERAGTLEVKAMEAIRAAVKDGYRDRGYLEGEPDFVLLRGREDFKALLGPNPTLATPAAK